MNAPAAPSTYAIVRRTWLSRKPAPQARLIVFLSLLVLAFGTVLYWKGAESMAASGVTVFDQHQYWRLWTTLFAHADMGHFLANSLLFVILGYFLAGYFSWHLFPVAALFFGGITNFFSILTYPKEMTLIGASGLVSWMGGAWLILYFLLNRQKTVGQRAMRAAGVALLLFAPSETFDLHISYRTHGIGFALGLLCGYVYFKRREAEFRASEVVEIVREEEDFNPPLLDGEA